MPRTQGGVVGRAVLVVAAAAAAAGVVAAQQPVFRGGADHVSVDVIVTDADERPVMDLTRDDFQIVESEKTQTVADFRFVSIAPRAEPVDLEAEPPPPRDVAVNARAPETSRAMVIIIDDNHIKTSDVVQTKRVLKGLLQGLSPDDQAAITYVRHSNLGQDFTGDFGRLVAAVNRMRDAFGFGATRDDTRVVVKNATNSLVAATQARKFIVYVSDGGAADPDDLEFARQHDIPVYPIDPIARTESDVPGGMHAMAVLSGGRAVVHPSDPQAGAGDLMAENGSYYLLGYYPSPFVRDDKFHAIEVRVTRPGVHVRARAGYWAGADHAPPDEVHRVNAALSAGMDNPGMPIRVFATPLMPTAKGMKTLIVAEVTYLPGAAGADRLDDELRLGVVALDPDGGIKAQHQRVVPFGVTALGTQPVVIVLDDVIDLPSRPLTLRIGVSSRSLAAAGTAHLPIDVPNAHDAALRVGGVALGLIRGHEDVALNPDALVDLIPFQPTTTRMLRTSDTVRVYTHAWWRPSGKADTTVTATVWVAGTDTGRTLTLTGVAGKDGRRDATLDTTLKLEGLAPGTHVLEIDVRRPGDPVGELREIVFDIAKPTPGGG